MLSEKTFTRSQIVSVTAAATVLVMAVNTDSGVSRGGMKKIKENAIEMESLFVCFTRCSYTIYIMFLEITKKSNSRRLKYIRLYEYSKDIKMVTR